MTADLEDCTIFPRLEWGNAWSEARAERFKVGPRFVPSTREEISTKTLQLEGIFPLPLDGLWRLLHAHLDEDLIHEIHPWIEAGLTIQEGERVEFQGLSFPREKVAERVVRVGGRPSGTTWHYRIEPPSVYAYRIEFENGALTNLENAYARADAGTHVSTKAELSIPRVPGFLATWLARRSLDRSDAEDLAYARKMRL